MMKKMALILVSFSFLFLITVSTESVPVGNVVTQYTHGAGGW